MIRIINKKQIVFNIKFSYLYRDAGNYKNYGEVIFVNTKRISIEEVEKLIRSKLIDGQWFYANEWGVPDLHFNKWDEGLDHEFHEFEEINYTEDVANYIFTLDYFCHLVKKSN